MKCKCGHSSKRKVPVFPWYCLCGTVWLSPSEHKSIGISQEPIPDPSACPHLLEETGETVACKTCGEGVTQLPVYRCAKHVETVMRKPVQPAGHKAWDGMVCLICIAQGLNE